jgi:phage tail sheath protein FI
MPTYKSPDVYVEEISVFPPSVAEVETAIPAFIGYTEKALLKGIEDVSFIPTEITSFVEYQEAFGGPAPVAVSSVELDANNVVTKAEVADTFYMYDSIRMFFQNGGGKCYVISIGAFKDNTAGPSKDHFLDGLTALKKQDEPTIILFPDAVLLENDALYEVQQQALAQCGDLGDRVAVFDLRESKKSDPLFDWKAGYQEFRDKIGINNLKYGAAYTPWIMTVFGRNVRYQDIKSVLKKAGVATELKKLTDDATIIKNIESLDYAFSDNGIINGDQTKNGSIKKFIYAPTGLNDPASTSLKEAYYKKVLEFRAKTNIELAKANAGDRDADLVRPSFGNLFNCIYDVADKLLDEWAKTGTILTDDATRQTVINDIRNIIAGQVKTAVKKVNAYNKNVEAKIGGTGLNETYASSSYTWSAAAWDDTFTTVTADNSIYPKDGIDENEQILNMKAAEPRLSELFEAVDGAITLISQAAVKRVDNYEETITAVFPLFKNILAKVSSSLTILPPSGAVAGIYAMVDNARGVFKAPANVSLSGVVGVTRTIDNKEQEDLNVDVVAGKSINAIRPFTGKGILVWGARTLAGNDNEWRYVPVRRFFNMVEESVKKSTYWAVFEPNDANTWVKVRGMIENYLIQKWREGALAGATPKDAFFVKCGLGVTMTAQDILEGRMNVMIGMAVVRPAEFIILNFSHIMQTS